MNRRTLIVAGAIVLALVVVVAIGMWFWGVLVAYINPGADGATDRKDTVQVFALIAAGVVASITAAVGLVNLYFSRKNLEQQQAALQQQRELEAQRAQGAALQAYYEQMGQLLTEHDLRNTERKDIRLLARGQTLTVLHELDANGKGRLLLFLYGAGLIAVDSPAIVLATANLMGANLAGSGLRDANLSYTNLSKANLERTSLSGANLDSAGFVAANLAKANLTGANLEGAMLAFANLREANLREANLNYADLEDADLEGAVVTDEQLAKAGTLRGATMPDGTKQPD